MAEGLVRWDPLREMVTLREAVDRLMAESFVRPGSAFPFLGVEGPAVDMYQSKDEVVVKAAIPGFKAGDVQVQVTGDVLTIRGEMHQAEDRDEKSWQMREQRWGAFERSVGLPAPVTADKAEAEFEDGILTITLPKAAEARSRSITVKANKR